MAEFLENRICPSISKHAQNLFINFIVTFGTKYSKMDQLKFVEDSL